MVGAGFSGLSAALELAQRGMSVVLLEADRIGSGASGRNGGQAIVGYASGQGPFEEQLGAADAQRAWDLSLEAVHLIEQRIAAHGIECDWRRGYTYVADSPNKARALREDFEDHNRRGVACTWAEGADVARFIGSQRYVAAFRENTSGHLHPLKYALGLARAAQAAGVRIFEHSPVTGLQRGATLVARTAQGQVAARFGVLAGNCMLPEFGPRVAPEIAPRIMPVGTYIVGTEPLAPELCERLIPGNAAVCDNNFVLDYFRFSADHRMLFGGRVSYTTRTPPRLREVMRALPRINEDVNEEWAHDKTRHHVDALVRNRLDRPWVREKGKLREATWAEALEVFAKAFTKAWPTYPAAPVIKMRALGGK